MTLTLLQRAVFGKVIQMILLLQNRFMGHQTSPKSQAVAVESKKLDHPEIWNKLI